MSRVKKSCKVRIVVTWTVNMMCFSGSVCETTAVISPEGEEQEGGAESKCTYNNPFYFLLSLAIIFLHSLFSRTKDGPKQCTDNVWEQKGCVQTLLHCRCKID